MPPSTRNVTPGVTGFRPWMVSSTRRASSMCTRTSTEAPLRRDDVRAEASVYGATFTVVPRAGSLMAKSAWITYEISRMALAPSSGSSPACAASRDHLVASRPLPGCRLPRRPERGLHNKRSLGNAREA